MTTIVSVRRANEVVIGGDGQATFGSTILKSNVKKVRKLYHGKIIAGFAGSTADAFTLFEFFEMKLELNQGDVLRSAVDLTKEWRSDKSLRRLEALMAVVDQKNSLIISGSGDIIQPQHNIIAIGSGGPYAQASAQALISNTRMSARDIVEKSLRIAGDICLYTNHTLHIEKLNVNNEI